MHETDVAIVGAGPHGLAAAAHLGRAGVETMIFGDPMSFWKAMPVGEYLRSNWTATSIAECDGPLSLDSYVDATGAQELRRLPIPLDRFLDYGDWVTARAAPHLDRRSVASVAREGDNGFCLTLHDETRIRARRVVVAAGISAFTHLPATAEGLPPGLFSHTSQHRDLSVFAEKTVLVVGGGQSALENAALMHESGAYVEVVARAAQMNWLHGGKYHRRLGRFAPLLYAPTDVGPMGISRVVAVPDLFRRLPRSLQEPMAYRAIRPAGAAWLRPRLSDVPLRTGTAIHHVVAKGDRLEVTLTDGTSSLVDHIMFGTGYRVNVTQYPFLPPSLSAEVRTSNGYPVLRPGMESSAPGLHFLGAPAAHSYGPIMRFIAGGWYGARAVTGAVTHRRHRGAITALSTPSARRSVETKPPTTLAAPRRNSGVSRDRELPGALVIGGDYQGLGIARSLGRKGVPVVVLDDERSIAGRSKYVGRVERTPDLRTPEAAVSALVDIHARLGLEGWVLYPTREEHVSVIAARRDELAVRFRVPTPSFASVAPAWDKRQTYRIAGSLGIPVPRCWFPRDETELSEVDVSSAVVVKPAIKEHFYYATKAKAWRADSAEELRAAYRRAAAITSPDEVIIQELVPGGGSRQLAYCALFKHGQAIADMTVRRHRQHPSDFGRASTLVETIDPAGYRELGEYSSRFLNAIDYYGLVELEFKQDPRDGTCKLLDVNARTWGYHTLGRAAGVDFAYLLYLDQLGEPVPRAHAQPGVRWIRLMTDIPNAVRDLRVGRVRAGDYLRSLRGLDEEAVLSLRDPLPGLYEVLLLPYLASRRGL